MPDLTDSRAGSAPVLANVGDRDEVSVGEAALLAVVTVVTGAAQVVPTRLHGALRGVAEQHPQLQTRQPSHRRALVSTLDRGSRRGAGGGAVWVAPRHF